MVRPIPKTLLPSFNGLIYSCSVLPSIYQTRCIRIKLPPLPQRPFHRPHAIKSFCASSYRGVYQTGPVQTRGSFRARQGACLHTALKTRTQRRLCPLLFVRSFWARPVRTRSDRVGRRVGEEDRGGAAIGDAARTY